MGRYRNRKGVALIVCLIFTGIFAALAVCMATVSGANLQVAKNQRDANKALAAAESGLEVMRYWLKGFYMPKTTAPEDYLSTIVAYMQSELPDRGVTNLAMDGEGSIPAVMLSSAEGCTFTAQVTQDAMNPNIFRLEVSGTAGGLTRTIQVAYTVAPYEHPIFNYGMATKGAIQFPQNPTFTATTANWEADIYTESSGSLVAIDVGGNLNFDGDIMIGNPDATANFLGDVQIAGETGQTAIDNHVQIGVEPLEFPAPETDIFQMFATGPILDPAADLSKAITLSNATIPSGMNPTFGGSVTVEGILYIESPNIVTFNRNCTVNGIIVGDGVVDGLADNQITVAGNFATGPYPEGEEFIAIQDMIGTSIMAPSFDVSLLGNFSTIDGVIATGTLTISGNASATVKGTIINYSNEPSVIDGNVSVSFDRASSVKIPAGFDTHRALAYDPASYTLVY
jgi:hypothetical protein